MVAVHRYEALVMEIWTATHVRLFILPDFSTDVMLGGPSGIDSSPENHYDDVIMTILASQITSLTVVYSIVYSGVNQRNIKAPRHWPLCGKFTGDRWISRTNGQLRGKCFHLMTSSCNEQFLRSFWFQCCEMVVRYIFANSLNEESKEFICLEMYILKDNFHNLLNDQWNWFTCLRFHRVNGHNNEQTFKSAVFYSAPVA